MLVYHKIAANGEKKRKNMKKTEDKRAGIRHRELNRESSVALAGKSCYTGNKSNRTRCFAVIVRRTESGEKPGESVTVKP